MVDWSGYFNGRDVCYPNDLTLEIRRNAARTIEVVNAVLEAMKADGVDLAGVHVASGWRPPAVNDHTANAASHSKHLTAEACDLADPNGAFRTWAVNNFEALEKLGVWIEDPRWTGSPDGSGWLHLQRVAPASGKRCFIPSSAPARDPEFYARTQPHGVTASEHPLA